MGKRHLPTSEDGFEDFGMSREDTRDGEFSK